MRKLAGKGCTKDGAKAGERIEQVAQEMAEVMGSGWRRRLPVEVFGRNHADEVPGALNLFSQLLMEVVSDGLCRQALFIVNEGASVAFLLAKL